jgi:hypothetical protein
VQPQAQPSHVAAASTEAPVTHAVERAVVGTFRSIERASFALGAHRAGTLAHSALEQRWQWQLLVAATKHVERALDALAERHRTLELESSRCARKPRLWRFGREEVTARPDDTLIRLVSLAVVCVTILGVAVGRYPFLRMNRATIAPTGATC